MAWHSTALGVGGWGLHTQHFRSTFHYRKVSFVSIGIPWEVLEAVLRRVTVRKLSRHGTDTIILHWLESVVGIHESYYIKLRGVSGLGTKYLFPSSTRSQSRRITPTTRRMECAACT